MDKERKSKPIYDCSKYSIYRIPLNFMIIIKQSCVPKDKAMGIDRYLYINPDRGIEEAKEEAEDTIAKYFRFTKGLSPRGEEK